MTRIGLEIHCQLTNLQSKLFCPCSADYRSYAPNSNICPVCAGIPGSLPRLNAEAVRKATMIAMALNCRTPERIAFFRKNYFYPDLPKNFQITQLDAYGETSIGSAGAIEISGRKIRIARVQLEEDPGRLIYKGDAKNPITLVDYNRAGTPLVEIVTEPDFGEPRQVREFITMLSDLLENLQVSDPGLEGAMRADANVSVHGGDRVEIKNIGSFHDLEKAIHYEITRQESRHARGLPIQQETRHWDDKRRITVSSRSKEESPDYRYFLEADIPWVRIDGKTLEDLRRLMPESIPARRDRYVRYGMPRQVADVLSSDKYYSGLFEEARTQDNAAELANLITSNLMGLADTREKRERSKITAKHLKDLAGAVMSGEISRSSAKDALHHMVKTGKDLSEVISETGLGVITAEAELAEIIKKVIAEEPQAAEQARTNPQTINFLVGRVMRHTGGRADPGLTLAILKRQLAG